MHRRNKGLPVLVLTSQHTYTRVREAGAFGRQKDGAAYIMSGWASRTAGIIYNNVVTQYINMHIHHRQTDASQSVHNITQQHHRCGNCTSIWLWTWSKLTSNHKAIPCVVLAWTICAWSLVTLCAKKLWVILRNWKWRWTNCMTPARHNMFHLKMMAYKKHSTSNSSSVLNSYNCINKNIHREFVTCSLKIHYKTWILWNFKNSSRFVDWV